MAAAISDKCAALAESFAAAAERELETADDLAKIGKDWVSVYWHAGFAVESLLKAIMVKTDGMEKWVDQGGKWHDITYAAARAGITQRLKHERKSKAFAANWLAVKDWDQSRRYPGNTVDKEEAKDLLKAIKNPGNGVMKCLRTI